jgi:hypothetical protein
MVAQYTCTHNNGTHHAPPRPSKEHVVVRDGRYSSEDIHRAVFPETPKSRSTEELKHAIRQHIRKKRAHD